MTEINLDTPEIPDPTAGAESPEAYAESMKEAFDVMRRTHMMAEMFALNSSIQKATHDARMDAIRKTGQ